mmetsp:Transcript_5871/g.20604  ORF Transcript_5871/g.20604 Transcript_5871/m.20604 type:complete len:199 (+) Transcript_5871:861-1457(+)
MHGVPPGWTTLAPHERRNSIRHVDVDARTSSSPSRPSSRNDLQQTRLQMVRVKNRYMLVHLRWKHANGRRECHPKGVCSAMQKRIRHLFGESTDKAANWKVLRLVDASTHGKTCVVKCERDTCSKVKAAVETVAEVGGWPVQTRVGKVSSALERCKQGTIARPTNKKKNANRSASSEAITRGLPSKRKKQARKEPRNK